MSNEFSRRDFLRWGSAGAGAAAVGGGVWLIGRNTGSSTRVVASRVTDAAPAATEGDSATTEATDPTEQPPATDATDVAQTGAPVPTGNGDVRRLVIVEMGGGNDGLSMVVPAGLGRYYDLRSRTAVDGSTVLGIDGTFGLHPNLRRLSERGGFAAVQGIGVATPDLSHFEMSDRWWAGDPDGTGQYNAGVIGRLVDIIADPSASAAAISIGQANHPALTSLTAPTMSIAGPSGGNYLYGADDGSFLAFQRAISSFASAGGDGWIGRIRATQRTAQAFSERLVQVSDDSEASLAAGGVEYPSGQFADGLRVTAQIFTADPTVRVVHVPMEENFDTHDDHLGPYGEIMNRFDEAVDAFRRDLDQRGLGNSVVIMTTSEFGRRIGDNGSNGLDHGTASTGLIIGPVNAGLYGQFPDLDDRDDTDNLKATVTMDQYYATVFEGWLGVPGGEIFAGNPQSVGGIF